MEHRKRITSALAILPPLLLFLYYAPKELFLVFVLALVALSLREYVHMLALVQMPICPKMSFIVAVTLVCVAHFGGAPQLSLGLSLSIMLLTLSVMFPSQYGPQRFSALLHSLFGVVFIGWGLSHLILLRNLSEGKWYIFFLCLLVWIGDSAAMYVGHGLGRRKLAPTISPGKTWEGAIGGVVGCVLAAVLSARLLVPHLLLWQSVVLGIIISVAAQISDLGESLIKRYAGVKDSGELIPGHGGVLDRIDSILFAAPTMFYTLDFFFHVRVP
jgi:phosphatidate cytidylyltransferase